MRKCHLVEFKRFLWLRPQRNANKWFRIASNWPPKTTTLLIYIMIKKFRMAVEVYLSNPSCHHRIVQKHEKIFHLHIVLVCRLLFHCMLAVRVDVFITLLLIIVNPSLDKYLLSSNKRIESVWETTWTSFTRVTITIENNIEINQSRSNIVEMNRIVRLEIG